MPTALRYLFASVLRVDWSRFEPTAALRCTLGVAVPLALGISTGSSTAVVFGTLGAFGVGFGSFQGAYRSQAIPMLLAAIGMAVSVLVGSLTGHALVPASLYIGLWGVAGGLLVALGQAASFVGLQSIIAAVIAAGFPADAATAGGRAALVLGGGLVQTALVVSIWPLRRFSAERRGLSEVYRSLATYASAIPRRDEAPEPHTLATLRSPLADPQPFARPGETLAFQALVDEAERIRASLAALALHRRRLVDSDRACAGAISGLSGQILAELANALALGREPRALSGVAASLAECASRLSPVATVEPLLAQLRAAWQTASSLAAVPGMTVAGTHRLETRRRRPVLRDSLVTLRANLSLESTAFRHALRLAAALVTAEVAARMLEIPRGYWLPLTVAVMLKPDFHDTVAASLARVAGTVLGAVGAIAIAHALGPGVPAVMVVLAFVWGAYALAGVNALAFAVCLTAYVVFVMTLGGVPEGSAAIERTVNTVLAGTLALGAYLAWPTWTARGMQGAIATMLERQATYLEALLIAYGRDAAREPKALDDLRTSARRARSNAEAIIERTLAEPYRGLPLASSTVMGLLAANRRVALAALALRAGLQREQLLPAQAIEQVAGDVDRNLRALARSVRDGTPVPQPLVDVQSHVAAAGIDAVVADEISVIVDGIDTMADLLRTDDGPGRAGRSGGLD